jgi:hypothetical protein
MTHKRCHRKTAPFVQVYPIGIPLYYYWLLRSNLDIIHDEDHPDYEVVSAKLSFLYRAYKEDAWHWEVLLSC